MPQSSSQTPHQKKNVASSVQKEVLQVFEVYCFVLNNVPFEESQAKACMKQKYKCVKDRNKKRECDGKQDQASSLRYIIRRRSGRGGSQHHFFSNPSNLLMTPSLLRRIVRHGSI